MNKFNWFLLFLMIPLITFILISIGFEDLTIKVFKITGNLVMEKEFKTISKLDAFENNQFKLEKLKDLENINRESIESYKKNNSLSNDLIKECKKTEIISNNLYDFFVEKVLGESIYSKETIDYKINIYEINEDKIKGYIAKIDLINPKSFELAIASSESDGAETISSMAKREEAIFAVNGGGFFIQKRLFYPIGFTIKEGKILTAYEIADKNFYISGIDKFGNLIGTNDLKISNKKIERIKEGVTFIPALIENGKKKEIPNSFKNIKHPRTVIGNYMNNELILIVIDGRSKESIGVSLENVQKRLLKLGVYNAYNLDGGGSSTFYYNGEILNKPSDGSERRVTNSFILK